MISDDDRHRSTPDRSVKVFRPVSQHPARAVHGVSAPLRDSPNTERAAACRQPWLSHGQITRFLYRNYLRRAAYRKSCVRAGALLPQTAAKVREIFRYDELMRGAGEIRLGQTGDRRVVVMVMAGGSVAWCVNYGSREKAPRDSREKRAANETPARSPTFRLTAGLTAGSDAPKQSLPPPVRATPRSRARQPPTFRPPPFSYLPVYRRSPSFPVPQLHIASLPLAIPSRRNLPFSTRPPPPLTQRRRQPRWSSVVGRRTPSIICPHDPAVLRHAERLKKDVPMSMCKIVTTYMKHMQEEFQKTRV